MTDSLPPLARRCQRIAPFHVMALLGRAQALQAAGHDVIHLEVGEPDFPTPAPILAAGQQALARGLTHYSPAAGIMPLREAIAGHYRDTFGVQVSPEQILITPGASGALQLLLALLVNPGDGVLVADPGYPCNRHFVELVNGVPRPLALNPAEGLRVTARGLDQAWQTDTVAALLASPDNPTGNVFDDSELAALVAVAAKHQGALIVDEIYQGLVYDRPANTVLRHSLDVPVINSFSKYFGMTGWRLGWLVAPQPWIEPLERMAQNFFLAASTPAQHAALAAFTPDTAAELERRRQVLGQRRRALLAALADLGLPVMGQPEGAFYIYVDVSSVTNDSFAFCERLLEEEKVALTPGLDFGTGQPAHRYLRFAYTCDAARIEEALARLKAFLERHG